MDYEKWYDDAITQIKKLKIGDSFEVKDLFTGAKWNDLPKGHKIGFGRYFSSKLNDGELPCVSRDGECKNHHNKYKKVSN